MNIMNSNYTFVSLQCPGDYTFNLKDLPKEIYQMIQDREAQKFEKELKQVTDAVNDPCTDLKVLRAKLSPTAQRVLNQVKAGNKDIPSSDWKTLCKELEKYGAISSSEVEKATGMSGFPVCYFDENGTAIPYPAPPFPMTKELRPQYINARGEMMIPFDWSGDPLQDIEDLLKITQEWLDDILRMRKEDGSPAYQRKDVASIENYIHSFQKVHDLIKKLSEA